jgi:hypothetical protein
LKPGLGKNIGFLRVHPVFTASLQALLPERRAGFQVVHQEVASGEGGTSMRAADADEHDLVSRFQFADAMDDRQRQQGPARLRFRGDRVQAFLRHAGVVFEEEPGDLLIVMHVTHQSAESDDCTDGVP